MIVMEKVAWCIVCFPLLEILHHMLTSSSFQNSWENILLSLSIISWLINIFALSSIRHENNVKPVEDPNALTFATTLVAIQTLFFTLSIVFLLIIEIYRSSNFTSLYSKQFFLLMTPIVSRSLHNQSVPSLLTTTLRTLSILTILLTYHIPLIERIKLVSYYVLLSFTISTTTTSNLKNTNPQNIIQHDSFQEREKQLQDEMKALEEHMKHVVANVAHDLKTVSVISFS
jgi:hypothetical protein